MNSLTNVAGSKPTKLWVSCRWTVICWIAWVACLQLPPIQAAEPYRPTDDNEVLETLPRVLLAGWNELTALRRQLAIDPNNTELACEVASRYLRIGNEEGDPRHYGYARAAIGPWWQASNSPPEVLRLRAKLQEKDHLYDLALADLRKLLKQKPRDAQAWIEMANIYRVQGTYEQAQAACDRLDEFANSARSQICRIPIQAVTGEAEAAYDSLAKTLPTAKQRWPDAVSWVVTMQAKIAWALGRKQEAEQHFLAGLEINPNDTYLMRDYADFLLDDQRAAEALELLGEHIRDNGILLRATIAARRCGKENLAATWQTQLETRFEEIRLRGGQPHGRYEARYLLELKDDPQAALRVALANWQKQKETRDTRNVLEAAVAAEDYEAGRPVIEFLRNSRTQNIVLEKLAQQLEGERP